jgi:hypothetical protein
MFSRFRKYVFSYDFNILWLLFKCAILHIVLQIDASSDVIRYHVLLLPCA